MFQTFEVTARPEQGPPRLAALRREMSANGLAGFLVPRADVHQGEYVAPRDERLAWLTGFTGSAGFCAVLGEKAGVFIDGRYRTQVKSQVAADFTPVPWPEVGLADWLKAELPAGARVGFDPWLHTAGQIEALRDAVEEHGITLSEQSNLVDRIWEHQPDPPLSVVRAHPIEFAGETHAEKRKRLADELADAGRHAALITLPDSLCWLLNIRGSDIPRNPVAHGFCVLQADGHVHVFMDKRKLTELDDHFGDGVTVHEPDALTIFLDNIEGPVQIEKSSVPFALAEILGKKAVWGEDPCALPKARKNAAEIEGTAKAHLRDGAAVVELLAWFDQQAPGSVTEIEMVQQLEACRRADNALRDISFETIAGAGPNGAIMHYRVTEETNSVLQEGQLIVLDSGGQYLDGTTDITRTLPVGTPPRDAAEAFTRVLQGMIGMSRLRWPVGLAGRDIEAIARVPLWLAGQDFNHGVGHGVGAYLSVHEGPQRLSRLSTVPLEAGMILSNEPGYYREGAFGIRIENLIVVEDAAALPGGDAERAMLQWRTLTFVPINKRLIVPDMLTEAERAWLNSYHAEVRDKIAPRVSDATRTWLEAATSPI